MIDDVVSKLFFLTINENFMNNNDLRVEVLQRHELEQVSGGGFFKEAGEWFGNNVLCPITCTLKTYFTWQYEDRTPKDNI